MKWTGKPRLTLMSPMRTSVARVRSWASSSTMHLYFARNGSFIASRKSIPSVMKLTERFPRYRTHRRSDTGYRGGVHALDNPIGLTALSTIKPSSTRDLRGQQQQQQQQQSADELESSGILQNPFRSQASMPRGDSTRTLVAVLVLGEERDASVPVRRRMGEDLHKTCVARKMWNSHRPPQNACQDIEGITG